MKKIIVIGIILFTIGLVGASLMVFQNMGLETATPFKHQKQTDGRTVNNVIVKSNTVDIEIYPSQNNQISAIFSGSKQENIITDLQLSTQKNTVHIEAKREETSKRLWINFNLRDINQPTKVAVYLPKKQYDSLALQTSHGDIKLNDFKGNSIKANASNGDIKVQNTHAILTLQTNHGDIDLSEVAFHGSNSITTSSGDIHIQSVSNPKNYKKVSQDQLLLKSSHGDIDLNGYQGNIVTANTSSGDIHMQNIDASFTVRTVHGDINIQSIKNFYVQNQVTASNGDIKVSVGHDPKSLNIDFKGSEVQSDYPIQIQGTTSALTNEYDNRQLKGVIGTKTADTPTLTMQTHHGDISFSR